MVCCIIRAQNTAYLTRDKNISKSPLSYSLGTMNSISSDIATPSLLEAKQRYFPWKCAICPSFGIRKVPELLEAMIRGSEKSKGLPSFVHVNL